MSPILDSIGSVKSYGWGSAAGFKPSFESIATLTSTGSTEIFTFSSIPSTYQHLQIRGIARGAAGTNGGIRITVNGDTAGNYNYNRVYASASTSTPFSDATANTTYIDPGEAAYGTDLANTFAAFIIDIHDYKSTSKFKTFRILKGKTRRTTNGDNIVQLGAGLWRSTSAITSITITAMTPQANNTSFALYGAKGE
jgi:hypothetical protein